MPPKQDDLAARMDPSKQRARGFNTGKGAKGASSTGDDSSAWFETPEQKQKRLQEEILGLGKPATPAPQNAGKAAKLAGNEAEAKKKREQIVRSHLERRLRIGLLTLGRSKLEARPSWTNIRRPKAWNRRTTQASERLIERRIWRAEAAFLVLKEARC